MKISIRLLLIALLHLSQLSSIDFIELPELEASVGHTTDAPSGGEETSFVDAHLTGVPSSIVNQVNVITGTYHDHHVDLVVPGPHPIKIERSYTSNYTRDHWFDDYRTLRNGWGFDHNNAVHFKYHSRSSGHSYKVKGETVEGASCMLYEAKEYAKHKRRPPEERDLYEMVLSHEVVRHGFTNCSSREISARTNIKNSKIIEKYSKKTAQKPSQHFLEQHTGSGALFKYQKLQDTKKQHDLFLLSKSKAPNGNFLAYKYNQKHHLAKVESRNRAEKRLGWVDFNHKTDSINLTSSDGQSMRYSFVKMYDDYFLSAVEGSDGYFEQFRYEPRAQHNKSHRVQQLIHKVKPNGRYTHIDYYHQTDSKVGNTSVHVKSRKDPRHGRVKHLSAPVGHDNNAVITHEFLYDLSNKKTRVFDAKKNITDYHFDNHDRLKIITKFNENRAVQSRDKFYWGSAENNKGNIISHVFANGKNNLVCRHFRYDSRGNPRVESLHGNLTGRDLSFVSVNSKGIPSTRAEKYVIKRRYSNNKRNLLLEETDHRKQTIYHYYPQSDLVEYQFTKIAGEIYLREFFEYDENAVMTKRIHDDGSTDNKDDLTGVTERHITSIIPRKKEPIGLPQEIHEKYLDIDSGEEILQSKTVNFHTPQGRLERQDKYDANGEFAYSLFWEYDSRGRVTSETNALGEQIIRKYDANDNLIYEKASPNKHTDYVYDYSNRLISAMDVLSDGTELIKKFNYNTLNQKESELDIYGNKTMFKNDPYGRVVMEVQPLVSKAWASGTFQQNKSSIHNYLRDSFEIARDNKPLASPKKNYEYDAMGNVTVVRDALDRSTYTAYTVRGKPYSIKYPDRSEEHKEYTLEGWLERDIDKMGTVTRFYHDPLGRVICQEISSSSGELLKQTYCTYNAFHMLTETDAMGHVTHYEYDKAGRLIKTSQGDRRTELEYDALGRVHITRTYDSPSTFTASIQFYDHLDRIIEESIEDDAGTCLKKQNYTYDCQGNRTHVTTNTQAGEAITVTLYNAFNQPEMIIDPLGNVTRVHFNYAYINEFGQNVACEETIDPLGNVTMTIHDAMGRLVTIKRKDSMGELIQQRDYHYDCIGNVAATTETIFSVEGTSHAVTKCCLYDSCNRLIEIIEAKGSSEEKHTRVQYNGKGLKELLVQPSGVTITYKYDALGRLKTFKSSDKSIHYSYSYDLNDNILQITDHIHDSATDAIYDQYNQLISEALGNELTLKYAYDSMGRLVNVIFPDQTQSQYTYKGQLITSVSRQKANHSYIHSYDSYDLAGHLTTSTLIGKAGTIKACYDLLGRVTKIEAPNWNSLLAYDAAGNLIDQQINDSEGNNSCSYTYDDLYQLKSETGSTPNTYQYDSLYNRISKNGNGHQVNDCNQLLDDGLSRYTYDINGNLVKKVTGDNVVKYAYDAINRLTEVEQGQHKTTYRYDAKHRRLESVHYVRNKSGWRREASKRYLYQGDNEIGCCDEQGNIQELRILGLSRGAENGAAIAIELGGNSYAPVHDHNGNVMSLIDAETSQIFESYRYTAFGEEKTTDFINPWRFSSKRVDSETGLIYFGNRYYDPHTGRWLTRDPLENTDGPNLYAYLSNNPLCNFDAYGLWGQTSSYGPQAYPAYPISFGPNFSVINETYFVDDFEENANSFNSGLHDLSFYAAMSEFEQLQYSPRVPYQAEHSHTFDLSRPNLKNGLGVGFNNGITTNLKGAIEHAEYLSDKFLDGANIFGVHNASHMIITDLWECILNLYWGAATNPVRELHRQWDAFLSTSNKPFLQFCHSQGAIHVRNALLCYPPELRERIIVVAVAPAAYISRDICKECYHYVSKRDIVPFFDVAGRKACAKDITYLEPLAKGFYLIDHDFQSPTYASSIQKHIEKYILDYGK